MEKTDFMLETKGHCLLCLSSEKESDNPPPSTSFPLERIFRHLNISVRNVFSEATSVAPESLTFLKTSVVKWTLCGGCGELVGRMSEMLEALELLRMKLDFSFKCVNEKVKKSFEDKEVLEDFMDKMESHSVTNLKIVGVLRRQIGVKSSTLLKDSIPRVALKRVKPKRDTANEEGHFPTKKTNPTGLKYKCSICHLSFAHYQSLLKHKKTTHGGPGSGGIDRRHKCNLCNSWFPRWAALIDHKRRQHASTRHKCDQCHLSFAQGRSLNRHKNRVHLGKRQAPKPDIPVQHPSAIRRKSRPSRSKGAIKIAHPIPAQCPTCWAWFENRTLLYQHNNLEHASTRYKCSLCPLTFAMRQNMNRHKRIIHKVEFGKRFLQAAAPPEIPINPLLEEDVVVELGEQSHFKEELETDNLYPIISLESEPFPLPDDHQLAAKAEIILPDANLNFENENDEIEIDYPSFLQEDPQQFESSLGKSGVNCDICGKFFGNPNSLTAHKEAIHFGKRYPCSWCQEVFTQPSSRNRHMKKSCERRPR